MNAEDEPRPLTSAWMIRSWERAIDRKSREMMHATPKERARLEMEIASLRTSIRQEQANMAERISEALGDSLE